MNAQEKLEILELLDRGQAALLAALDGVSEENAARIPGPGRWSILGCAEHVAISEDYLFSQICKAAPSETPLINKEREAKMLARGDDRSRRIECPPEGQPSGRFPTLDAALEHFLKSRKRTVSFVQGCEEDLRAEMTWHPILKEANCHEMLISIGVHCLRHVKQIEEVKRDLS